MCNLTIFQKGTYYIILYYITLPYITFTFTLHYINNLPTSLKNLSHDTKQFRFALKRFLLLNEFYSLEEYFNFNII
jgi:hypothetical protein